MFVMVLLFTLLMFVYSNTMYYTFVLLLVIFNLVGFMVMTNVLQSLTAFMLLIVYVGAMMILIGYICAISPNLISTTNPSLSFFVLLFFSMVMAPSVFTSPSLEKSGAFISPMSFFYTDYGLFIFIVVALSLFITLLMVTTQFLVPKGPFRSVTSSN